MDFSPGHRQNTAFRACRSIQNHHHSNHTPYKKIKLLFFFFREHIFQSIQIQNHHHLNQAQCKFFLQINVFSDRRHHSEQAELEPPSFKLNAVLKKRDLFLFLLGSPPISHVENHTDAHAMVTSNPPSESTIRKRVPIYPILIMADVFPCRFIQSQWGVLMSGSSTSNIQMNR